MLKRLVKRAFHGAGLDLTRRRDPSLPLLHHFVLDDREFAFWLTNEHTKRWWHKPTIGMNAELRALKTFCRSGATVLEVGAHHGLHTLAMCHWIGSAGHVHAIEANADNAVTLFANVAANGLLNCTCTHAAGGERSGSVVLDGETVGDGDGRATPVLALDEYCRQHSIERVDLVKIDVEGYEAQVLRGARALIASYPCIALELHLDDLARYGSSVEEIASLLDIERYRVQMMERAVDWDSVRELPSIDRLPAHGVVNLFLTPTG